MKSIVLATLLALLPGGERERGLQLYRDGRFAEAAAAFRAAVAEDGDSAELQWNLALASWRAGDLAAAETAAEKYAALAKDAQPALHAGLLGVVRHGEAEALSAQADAAEAAEAAGAGQPPAGGAAPTDPLPLLQQAKAKAEAARDHFARGAAAAPSPELQRNFERSLRTIAALERRIEELQKQREQQPKSDDQKPGDQPKDDKQDEKKDDKQDGSKPDDKRQQDQKQQPDQQQDGKQGEPQPKADEPKPGEQKPGEQPPPPQQGDGKEPPEPQAQQGEQKPQDGKQGEPQPEPKPGEQQPPPSEPKPATPRQDAPGEAADGRELTPEQAQRLLEQLRDLDDKLRASRARSKSGRRPVERDW
ncbi:MAG: hypothetical protein ACK5S5_12205 [Planctomycetota bacterium]